MLQQYWGEERVYHHTAPISMNYALREALRLVAEEGLEARFARHRLNHEALAAGSRRSARARGGGRAPACRC
jgi:alanine-glyoxylate transaminase/serine-glyoxylate transaminase/serine-pyruvate transaminase